MKIKFIYTSQIALAANTEEEIIEIQVNANIQQAIATLLLSKTEDFKRYIFDETNSLLQAILLIKNGTQFLFKDLSPLKDGDEIMFFSPMSGG